MGTLLQDVRLWFAHAGQEAHIHDRGRPDAGSGRGSQHGHFQHRECRVAAFSALPRSRSVGQRSREIVSAWPWARGGATF
jgi:hypothetical protein